MLQPGNEQRKRFGEMYMVTSSSTSIVIVDCSEAPLDASGDLRCSLGMNRGSEFGEIEFVMKLPY